MAPLTSTEMRSAKENTRSISCSIRRTVTSRGRAATAARISWRSLSGTPAAGSSSSSTRGEVVHDVEQMKARQRLRDLLVDVAARAHPPPPVAAAAEPFGYRKAHGLE